MKKIDNKLSKVGSVFLIVILTLTIVGASFAHWQETLIIKGNMTTDNIYPYFTLVKSNDCNEPMMWDATDCGEWLFNSGWQYMGDYRDKNIGWCEIEVNTLNDQVIDITIGNAYPCYYAHPMFVIKNKGSCPVLVNSIKMLAVGYQGIKFALEEPIDLIPYQRWGVKIGNDGLSADVHQPVCNAKDDFSIMLTSSDLLINQQLDPEFWHKGDGHLPDDEKPFTELQGGLCICFENGCEEDVSYNLIFGLGFFNWPEFVLVDPELTQGDIIITEIMMNPSKVSDSAGEWFEIYNTRLYPINLNGCSFGDMDSDSYLIDTDFFVPGLSHAVLCCNEDILTNGGVDCSFEYDRSLFLLTNSEDEIVLTDSNDVVIDAVTYTDEYLIAGHSLQLDMDFYNHVDNDDASSWCNAETVYGDGDYGTPGVGWFC